MKITFFLLTAFVTYHVASLVQTVIHRTFGHAPRVAKLSDKWIQPEQNITRYYAVPFVPIVCAAYCLLPGIYFVAHVAGLAFAIAWQIYLHRQYHTRGAWWERFEWFQTKRRLHFVHHRTPDKNFAIVEYSWDLLLGTFEDNVPSTVEIHEIPTRKELKRQL